MSYRMDFEDPDSVWQFRAAILARLKGGTMPPENEHGPWPEEMIALFQRWVTAGEDQFGNKPPCLTMPVGSNYALDSGLLECDAQVPSQQTKTWFHLIRYGDDVHEFNLYSEFPPNAGPAETTVFPFTKMYPTPGFKTIIVNDANGAHRIDVPQAIA